MRVSVIVPCFNAAAWLGATLESVLAQTHADVELIVVDDASTDDSAAVIATFGTRVRRLFVPHGGGPRARNRGLDLATGDAVMFLDADDLIAPETLAALVGTLQTSSMPAVAACPWRDLVSDGAARPTWRPVAPQVPARPPGDDPLAAWLEGWYLPTGALLWPRDLLAALGGWDEGLTINQDGDLALRALTSGARLVFASRGEALYRRHGGARRSVSGGRSPADLRSKMRVLEKVGDALAASGRLATYQIPLGRAYHELARLSFRDHRQLAGVCAARADTLAGRRAITGGWPHRLACHLIGLELKERLAAALAARGLGRASRLDV